MTQRRHQLDLGQLTWGISWDSVDEMVLPNDLPEPDNFGDDGLSVPAYQMHHVSSDSDSEVGDGDNIDGGYQLLPQDPDQASDQEDPEDDDETADAPAGFFGLPEAPAEWRPTEEMLRPAEPRRVEPLAQAQIQAIQTAMAGFELPSSHVPPWARDVPEEEWKQCLYRKLRGLAPESSRDSTTATDNHTTNLNE